MAASLRMRFLPQLQQLHRTVALQTYSAGYSCIQQNTQAPVQSRRSFQTKSTSRTIVAPTRWTQTRTLWGRKDDDGDKGPPEEPNSLIVDVDANSCTLGVPLPRGTTTIFATSPTLSVAQFKKTITDEDSSVKSVDLFNYEGDAISGSMLMGNILPQGFQILMNNDTEHHWVVEKTAAESFNVFDLGVKSSIMDYQSSLKGDLLAQINSAIQDSTKAQAGDVNLKKMVEEMYVSFKKDKEEHSKQVELETQLAELESQAESKRLELVNTYNVKRWKSHDLWAFFGLGLTSVFWAGFARATFDIYSWDFMEPVTYFYTFGVQLLFMMYYIIWRHSFEFESWKDWHFDNPKLSTRMNQDAVYRELQEKIAELKQKQ